MNIHRNKQTNEYILNIIKLKSIKVHLLVRYLNIMFTINLIEELTKYLHF
jgi:hypothetical protein